MAHAENQVNGGLDAGMGSREVALTASGQDMERTCRPERELLCRFCLRLPADGSID